MPVLKIKKDGVWEKLVGEPGNSGKDGVSATHSWNGTVLTMTSASGTSSADLKGDKGDSGKDGNTPVKGTDYFTEEDKSELINTVLTQLPQGTSESNILMITISNGTASHNSKEIKAAWDAGKYVFVAVNPKSTRVRIYTCYYCDKWDDALFNSFEYVTIGGGYDILRCYKGVIDTSGTWTSTETTMCLPPATNSSNNGKVLTWTSNGPAWESIPESDDSDKTLAQHLTEEDMVLSSRQYGDTLPEPGTPGRIFFLKVST